MHWESESRSVTKPVLLRLLADFEAAGWCRQASYLTAASLRDGSASLDQWPAFEDLTAEIARSETGLAVFSGDDRIVAVAPPFPLASEMIVEGPLSGPLGALLKQDLLVGTVLLRLGRYAVGVLEGEALVASKTGSRYVKSRHRAGGSSQRRFERSRERLVREFFDEACGVVANVFRSRGRDPDYVLLGGERHTLRQFVERCPRMQKLAEKTPRRLLSVDRPNRKALDGIGVEVWRSRVVTFVRGG